MTRKTRRTAYTATASALLLAAALGASAGSAHAYGYAAPMGVIGIEAQAPVGSLIATAAPAPALPTAAVSHPAGFKARLLALYAGLKQRFGVVEVAAR